MNTTILPSPDIMLILSLIAVSFALGGAYRLGRAAMRERRAVELTDRDLQALSDRYENQRRKVSRLTRELNDLRQALMQQAMAMGPVHAALRMPGSEPAMAPPVPVPVPQAPAADARPGVAPATGVAREADDAARARSGDAPAGDAVSPVPATPPTASAGRASRATATRVSSAAAERAPAAPSAGAAAAASRDPTPQELARAGASVEALVARCALSRAEAELVVSVHGTPRRSAA